MLFFQEVPKAGRGNDSSTKEAQNSAERLNKERVEDKKPKGGKIAYIVLLDVHLLEGFS